MKESSQRVGQASKLFRVFFPKQIFDLSKEIADYIGGQVEDYRAMIERGDTKPAEILGSVFGRAHVLGGDQNTEYLNNSPYILALLGCFEKIIGAGRVVDQETITDCKLEPLIAEH